MIQLQGRLREQHASNPVDCVRQTQVHSVEVVQPSPSICHVNANVQSVDVEGKRLEVRNPGFEEYRSNRCQDTFTATVEVDATEGIREGDVVCLRYECHRDLDNDAHPENITFVGKGECDEERCESQAQHQLVTLQSPGPIQTTGCDRTLRKEIQRPIDEDIEQGDPYCIRYTCLNTEISIDQVKRGECSESTGCSERCVRPDLARYRGNRREMQTEIIWQELEKVKKDWFDKIRHVWAEDAFSELEEKLPLPSNVNLTPNNIMEGEVISILEKWHSNGIKIANDQCVEVRGDPESDLDRWKEMVLSVAQTVANKADAEIERRWDEINKATEMFQFFTVRRVVTTIINGLWTVPFIVGLWSLKLGKLIRILIPRKMQAISSRKGTGASAAAATQFEAIKPEADSNRVIEDLVSDVRPRVRKLLEEEISPEWREQAEGAVTDTFEQKIEAGEGFNPYDLAKQVIETRIIPKMEAELRDRALRIIEEVACKHEDVICDRVSSDVDESSVRDEELCSNLAQILESGFDALDPINCDRVQTVLDGASRAVNHIQRVGVDCSNEVESFRELQGKADRDCRQNRQEKRKRCRDHRDNIKWVIQDLRERLAAGELESICDDAQQAQNGLLEIRERVESINNNVSCEEIGVSFEDLDVELNGLVDELCGSHMEDCRRADELAAAVMDHAADALCGPEAQGKVKALRGMVEGAPAWGTACEAIHERGVNALEQWEEACPS